MSSERYVLGLSVLLCAAAFAGWPPPDTPESPEPAPASATDTADDGLIEFLGEDDVGDATWWEFFMKTVQRGENPPSTAQTKDAKR